MAAPDYGLWKNLRADPVLAIVEPKPRARLGDWLTELGVRGWPPAPENWTLRQMLAEDSLALIYLHRTTARGATAVLVHKPNANGPGKPAWRFNWGMTWVMCMDLDCDYDGLHLVQPHETAGAKEIKALLTEGTPE